MARVVAEARAERRELVGLKSLVPLGHETLERYAELFAQPGNRGAIAALVKFALQLATHVADTQARAVRRAE